MATGEASDNFKKLCDRRKYIKGRITHVEKMLGNIEEIVSIDELNIAYERLRELFSRLEEVNMLVESIDESQLQEGLNIEQKYTDLVVKIRKRLEQIQNLNSAYSTPPEHKSAMVGANLPKVSLPTFGGDYSAWMSFKDLFVSMVHENESLNAVQKFFYLKSCLVGEAAALVSTLQCTNHNYEKAWATLLTRYDNLVLIASHHIQSILSLSKVNKNYNLRRCINDFKQCHNSLLSLDIGTNLADVILIHILSSKLDYCSVRDFELQRSSKEFPKLDDFVDFLQQRCQALELASRDEGAGTSKLAPSTRSVSNVAANQKILGKSQCLFCSKSHSIIKCFKFIKLTPTERCAFVDKAKLCTLCLSNHSNAVCPKQNFSCKVCQQKHNNLLHITSTSSNVATAQTTTSCDMPQVTPSATAAAAAAGKSSSVAMSTTSLVPVSDALFTVSLLPTAVGNVCDAEGNTYKCRILLDNGSQRNYVTKEFAQKLKNNSFVNNNLSVAGVGGHVTRVNKWVELTIFSTCSDFKICSEFGVLDHITDPLPTVEFPKNKIFLNSSIKLADPDFHISKGIDMILGANSFALCLNEGKLILGPGMPMLLNTAFGWVFCGDLSIANEHITSSTNMSIRYLSVLHNDIQKFWQLEDLPNNEPFMSSQEKVCEQKFAESVSRDDSGRYHVDLPVNEELLPKLGNSYNLAYRCFISLEKRFQSNPAYAAAYKAFIHEFIDLGHAHYADRNFQSGSAEYYMPHHAVLKESSSTTKLRVVFNASAPTSSGISLNDVLLVGPVVQPDMLATLLRFRTFLYVFVSDITKMYRQIRVKPKYQPLQRILWRDNPTQEMQCLQLETVTYGTASASFLATRTLVQLVEDEGSKYPLASEAILQGTYVDDVLFGKNDLDSALRTIQELEQLLSLGQFELHKWYSNSTHLLNYIPPERREKRNFSFNDHENSAIKTLGLKWEPSCDQFQVSVPEGISSKKPTKRNVLADIAKVYDPLGFIAPVTAFAKLIMQTIWKENIGWDSQIPNAILKVWKSFCANLNCLNSISVPRLIFTPGSVVVELHGFADSSSKAYGCVIYARCILPNKNTVHFVCAKSRVAPLKPVTLPRLELCAALLLAKLMSNVAKILRVDPARISYWTDSMITLCWIRAEPAKWNVFVSNRVAQIQDLSPKASWKHVRSADNPADVVSRGLEPQFLVNCGQWFNGPSWLPHPNAEWPSPAQFENVALPEQRQVAHVVQEVKVPNLPSVLKKFSSWSKLVRVIAYVRRFLHNCKSNSKRAGFLTARDLKESSNCIISCVQRAYFSKQLEILSGSHNVDFSRPVFKEMKYLSIFVDKVGMLRVGGRLRHASIAYDQKFPLLLPSHCHVTDLIIRYEHERLLHAGTQTTLSSLRQYVWPLNGRNRVRNLVHKCIRCYRYKGDAASQVMADLPKYRVTPNRPFLITGIDFAGPLSVKVARLRKPLITKGYICVFVCLSTKAIHLELVSDLTTKEFLNALRRFFARRGKCVQIFSDNGTTFHGANNELKALYNMFKKDFELISDFLACENVDWHFIPPVSPHWGGMWESSVKLMKHHLKRVLGDTVLSYEHLCTLLCQIEAIVNSRPISPLRDEAGDDQCLTPAHFLVGDSLTSFPECNLTDVPNNRLSIYKQLCKLRQTFWKRWRSDYLNTLQVRYKWYNVKPDLLLDSIVLLKDDGHPPHSWPLGRVIKLFPGKDGHVRAVLVRTKNGAYTRPITKVVPLPVDF